MTNDRPILTDDQIAQLKSAYQQGATDLEAAYETKIAEELIDTWKRFHGGLQLIQDWRVEVAWEKKKRAAKALGIFLEPTNHKEAESVVKRHPLLKKEWSERTEHTGADGKDLIPEPIYGGKSQV